jgi:RimJ/RimL family protein N-acetyltransferase
MTTTRFLTIDEFGLYGDWLREQSPETLANYFGISVNSTYINNLVDGIESNPEEHYFLVATQGTTWAGVIHMARISEHDMEFGVMVSEQHRHQGIANQLMSEAITWIQNRGYDTLYLHCLNRNHVMQHLAVKHGLELVHDHGDVEARAQIPPPGMISYAKEAVTHNRNLFVMTVQQAWRPFNETLG